VATAVVEAAVARRTADLIELDRLGRAEVGVLAEWRVDGARLPAGLDEFLERHAEGRPFFVEEVLTGLVEDASLVGTDGSWRFDARSRTRIPPTYTAWMAERLAAVDPGVALILRAAAVLGRDVEVALLASMPDVDAATVRHALEVGARMQILGPSPGGPDRLRFRHARSRRGGRDAAADRPGHAGRRRAGHC
jgi:predicted ATPase